MNFFTQRRIITFAVLWILADPVAAQEPGPKGYHPAKLPREIHAAHLDDAPYLVEMGRDAVEMRCRFEDPAIFKTTDGNVYYCTDEWTIPIARGGTYRFDRAPSELPHLVFSIGSTGARLGCDLGTLHVLHQPQNEKTRLRFACR